MKRMKKEQGVHSKNERLLQSQRNILNECEILVLQSSPRRRPREKERKRLQGQEDCDGGLHCARDFRYELAWR